MMLSGKLSAPAPAGVRAPQRSGFSGTVAPLRAAQRCNRRAVAKAAQANAAADAMGDPLPSPEKRTIMNLFLLGAAGLTTAGLAGPYLYFFFPTKPAGQGDLLAAKDALGNEVKATKWIKDHKPNDRSLTQGLKSDATYLIVTPEQQIETFGLNAVCTHLGCVVPWSETDNKFKCPCHGSQYNNQGKVVRGPAPLSLALAHTEIKDDTVYFSEWKEKDFRTGLDPWWH